MSMAIKASTIKARRGQFGGNVAGAQLRAALQGDPGFFGFLGDAIGAVAGVASKVLPGPLGGIAGALSGALSGSAGLSGGPGVAAVDATIVRSGFQAQDKPIIDINFPFQEPPGVGVTLLGGGGGGKGSGTALMKVNGNGACASGWRLNKSSYFLKNGTFVPEGSRCVKIRRRNALNPRAASRAIDRLESTKKAMRRIDRFSIRCKRHRRMSCKEC